MWAWINGVGSDPSLVHVVAQMQPYGGLFVVTASCGRSAEVRIVFGVRPGESHDLCETCEPVVSARASKENA
jgi:hypothetical protein